MNWTDTIKIKEKDYSFKHIEEDPLVLIMEINVFYFLQRQINCDTPTEHITLVHKYTSVRNGIAKDDTFSVRVYDGKEITSLTFMTELLEHVFEGRGLI